MESNLCDTLRATYQFTYLLYLEYTYTPLKAHACVCVHAANSLGTCGHRDDHLWVLKEMGVGVFMCGLLTLPELIPATLFGQHIPASSGKCGLQHLVGSWRVW